MNRAGGLTLGAARPLLSSACAILAAFVAGGVFLALRGKDPLAAYRLLFGRGLFSSFGVTETLIKSAPLLLVGAGLLIALKAGVWNIGIDGQFLVGACLTGVVAPKLVGDLPVVVLLLVAALAGFAGGLAWAIVPALLKVRYGLNEIITTIMMNYVAIYLTSWLVKGPFKDPNVVPPQTVLIPKADRLPFIPSTRVHIGLLAGVVAVLLVAFLFRRTVLGFRLRTLGQSMKAAIHAGMPVRRLTVLALLLSGGCAGLAGANHVLGVRGLFQGEGNPEYGLSGFALVYLARLNPLWVFPFAYFFAFLGFGGELMARRANIPTYYVPMLEGLMLVFFAVAVYLERFAGHQRRPRRAPATETPEPTFHAQPEEST